MRKGLLTRMESHSRQSPCNILSFFRIESDCRVCSLGEGLGVGRQAGGVPAVVAGELAGQVVGRRAVREGAQELRAIRACAEGRASAIGLRPLPVSIRRHVAQKRSGGILLIHRAEKLMLTVPLAGGAGRGLHGPPHDRVGPLRSTSAHGIRRALSPATLPHGSHGSNDHGKSIGKLFGDARHTVALPAPTTGLLFRAVPVMKVLMVMDIVCKLGDNTITCLETRSISENPFLNPQACEGPRWSAG